MRVTQTLLSDRALAALREGLSRMAKTQNQLGTGRRINTPSDDPAGHSIATRLTARVATLDQYDRQATAAQGPMMATNDLLGSLSDLAGRAQELAVAGATGGLGAGERAGIATEVNQMLEEVVAVANGSEHGRYLLGGQETRTAPLSVTRNVNGDITAATWNPRGVDGTINATISDGVNVQTNIGGTAVLGADTDSTFLPALLVQLRDALNTNNQAAVNAVIDQFNAATTRLGAAQAQVGGQLQAIDRATSANDTARTAAKAALSAVADADVAKIAVDLSQQEAVYQAALHAASQAIQPSLLEFLK